MKKLLLWELLILGILCNSCSKDSGSDTITPPPPPSLKVKTTTVEITRSNSYHYLSTTTFSYDAQDRLIRAQGDSGYITFTYENNVVKKELYPTGHPGQQMYYYLNAMGLLDSVATYTDGYDGSFHLVYQYNSKNQPITIIGTGITQFGITKDTTDQEYNSDGDLIRITQGDNVNTYEFSDKPNFHNSMSMLLPGAVPNAHLVKSSHFSYKGVDYTTTSYAYEYDNEGRMKKITNEST